MKKFSSTTKVSSRRTLQTKKRIGSLIIVGLVAMVLLWLIPWVFSTMASIVMFPIQSSKTWLFESSGNLPLYLRDRSVLIEENEQLKEALALANNTDFVTDQLKKENDELRSLLGAKGEQRVLAAVIGRPGDLPYDVLVIDQGSNNGVVLDAPVYIGDNRVIGMVTKVFGNSSVVELVTTPQFVSSVFIVGPNIYTNAVGIGGGQLRVGVPQGIELSIGDSVILPAVSSGVFGVINHIESLPTRPEQHGFVSTEVPLQSLRYVAVGGTPVGQSSFEAAQEVVAQGLSTLFTVPVPDGVLVVTDTASTTATTTATSTDEVTETTEIPATTSDSVTDL